MMGNGRQWVFDIYSEYYYGMNLPLLNPQGPDETATQNQHAYVELRFWTLFITLYRCASPVPWSPGTTADSVAFF